MGMRGLKLKCSLETTVSWCLFKYWGKEERGRVNSVNLCHCRWEVVP